MLAFADNNSKERLCMVQKTETSYTTPDMNELVVQAETKYIERGRKLNAYFRKVMGPFKKDVTIRALSKK